MYLYGYDPEFAALLAGDDDDPKSAETIRGARVFATLMGLAYAAAALAVFFVL